MFSSSHSLPTLTNFLMNFRHDAMKLHHGQLATPAHLEINLSWASLLSCLCGLYGESIDEYPEGNWRIVNDELRGNDLQKGIVHFCTSHLMNTVCRKLYWM